jgi:hypothetical protein
MRFQPDYYQEQSVFALNHRSDRSDKTCQFWVRTHLPLKVTNWSKIVMASALSPIPPPLPRAPPPACPVPRAPTCATTAPTQLIVNTQQGITAQGRRRAPHPWPPREEKKGFHSRHHGLFITPPPSTRVAGSAGCHPIPASSVPPSPRSVVIFQEDGG